MPAPNANFNPPANFWDANGQFQMPQSVMDTLKSYNPGGANAGMPGGPGNGPGTATGAPGASQWAQYLMKYPDLMAEWTKLGSNPKNTFKTPDEYAQWHWTNYGQKEGRSLPGSAPTPDPGAGAGAAAGGGGGNPLLSALTGGAAQGGKYQGAPNPALLAQLLQQ